MMSKTKNRFNCIPAIFLNVSLLVLPGCAVQTGSQHQKVADADKVAVRKQDGIGGTGNIADRCGGIGGTGSRKECDLPVIAPNDIKAPEIVNPHRIEIVKQPNLPKVPDHAPEMPQIEIVEKPVINAPGKIEVPHPMDTKPKMITITPVPPKGPGNIQLPKPMPLPPKVIGLPKP